ncbi:hypothetical protein [Microbacterium dextranolyticum]|uniref:Uncharacterized protein n=1 Tax=Microbacterium dextranolyticum TaxID=36806 RepID=A0A9W6HPV2_9MICO|nr:hypothetical protein [Microbacterium dextranolyticum]MBM7463664.1 hypothetical protein [Microbacterium dextranolyticum]GLJ96505.1 hypothetical protein GCM10017591_25680 [Microbacterium dextranolyticum]
MATASIPALFSPRTSARRTPLRERVSAAGAAVLSIIGSIGAIALIVLALLVVPVAAALAFGPALLSRL